MGQMSPVSRSVTNTGRRSTRAARKLPTTACLSWAWTTSARARRASAATARASRQWKRGLTKSRIGARLAPRSSRRQNGNRTTATPPTSSRAAAP